MSADIDWTRHIGRKVIYRTTHAPPEEGVIVDVRRGYVMVRYGADIHAKATRPGDIELLGGAR